MQTRVKIIVLLVSFYFSIPSFGQISSLGASIGPAFSKPFIDNTSGISNSTTYKTYSDAVVSVFGQYAIKEKLGLLLDVGICHRGVSATQPVTLLVYDPYDGSTSYRDRTNKYEHNFSYLDNHLLAKYTIGNKFKVYANAGIYYSLLLRARKFIRDEYYDSLGTAAPTEVHNKYADNLKFSYKKSDLGFAVGLGIEYGRIGLDYRYSIGAMDISKYPETVKVHSSFSTIKLTFKFAQIKNEQLPHSKHMGKQKHRKD